MVEQRRTVASRNERWVLVRRMALTIQWRNLTQDKRES